jgi:hypothetical protein
MIERRERMKSVERVVVSLLLFYFLAANPSFAGIGIRAGVNLASQRQGGAEMQALQPGVLAGFFSPMKINEMFTVQPEVSFIQRGSKKVMGESLSSYEVTTKLNVLDLALISKIVVADLQSLKPHLLFGPYLSYLLSGTYVYGGGTAEEKIDDYHKLELGYSLGAGLDVLLGKMKVYLDARFSHSLTDVHLVPSHIWNKGFSLSAGYSF